MSRAKNRTNQEAEEKFYSDSFLRLAGLSGSMVFRGDDPPDFQVVTPKNKRIAVEVTEFHAHATGMDGVPRRAVEESWNKLCETITHARKDFDELKDISCYMRFKGLKVPPKNEHRKFAIQLIQFIKSTMKKVTNEYKTFSNFSAEDKLLSKYLISITIAQVNCYITWSWNQSMGMVGVDEIELIKIISAKSKPSYGGSDRNWLLIVFGHNVSQSMGIPLHHFFHNLTNKKISEPERVEIFLFYQEKKWWPLKRSAVSGAMSVPHPISENTPTPPARHFSKSTFCEVLDSRLEI